MTVKFKFLLFLSFYLILNSGFCQSLNKDSLPIGLMYEFKNRFPGVDEINWEKSNYLYIATFNFMNQKTVAHFDTSLIWIFSSTFLQKPDLPKNIQRYLSVAFSDLIFNDAYYIEKKEISSFYEIRATTSNNEKRILLFDKEGVFTKITDDTGEEIFADIKVNDIGLTKISTKELPSLINSYISVSHNGFRIVESYLVNNDTLKNTYYVIIGNIYETEKIELWFDQQGYLVKEINPFKEEEEEQQQQQEIQKKEIKKKKEENNIPVSEVPQAVLAEFTKRFKRVDAPKWDTIDGKYIVRCRDVVKRENYTIEFDKDGHWLQTGTYMNPYQLDASIQEYIATTYPDITVLSCGYYEKPDKSKYILIKLYYHYWLNDPMVYHELYYSRAGKLEKQVIADFIAPPTKEEAKKDKEQNEFLELTENENISTDVANTSINVRELPSKIINHISYFYSDHKIVDAYLLNDEVTNEIVYWIIIQKIGYKYKKKIIFNYLGEFIDEEDL